MGIFNVILAVYVAWQSPVLSDMSFFLMSYCSILRKKGVPVAKYIYIYIYVQLVSSTALAACVSIH